MLIRAIALLLLSAAFACKEEARPPEPKAAEAPAQPDFAKAFQHTERWDPEKKALVVDMTIAPGYHAYTTGETTGKPLLVEIAADSDLTGAGEIEYPKGSAKDLPIGRSVIVEGNAHISAPLAPKEGAPAGLKKVKGSLRYQICTEKVCDRPRTAPITVDVPG